ncbi:GDP-mannose-dependent alpha-(1-6)-phosphatidylinositol monomannoside mannosyltransferase [bacterium BMS3Abin04]|nr:GDP-mannose-dependent alpha-(1-6)-phosphatidylinositol monomannoside mannosyltransferase [bacterium BMS3Abin04]
MRTAIVHDWFVNYMGSEKCVESFVNIWKDADVFSLVDHLTPEQRNLILGGKKVTTSFIQKLPFSKKHHRNYLPLFPLAIEQFDLSKYKVIISSSHAVAKGVITNADQLHISYCHTPMRYAWASYSQYVSDNNLSSIKGFILKYILHKLRIWDYVSSKRVDYFIANSNHIARRIKKIYGRDADVIYPPVDVNKFPLETNKDDYYLTVSRFVPYKKIDLIVKTFSKLKDKKLVVIGNGPELDKIKKLAGNNVELKDHQSFESLKKYMQKAKAFVFAAEEDFGITIVEAQACGTPVIAYKVGGASETVINNKTGVLFDSQTEESLTAAIEKFESSISTFDAEIIHQHASLFSRDNFERNMKNYVDEKLEEHFNL